MTDTFREIISDVKKRILTLKRQLRKIPESRKINCTIEEAKIEKNSWIYKPRFNPSLKEIPQSIKQELILLFDDIDIFLKPHSLDEFSLLKNLMDRNPENKKSLIFLLERDVYNTDEVYGKYLVKKREGNFIISYCRRDKIIKTLPVLSIDENLEDFIIKDAINQIQTQFDKLWATLENEINRCENSHISHQKNEKSKIANLIKSLLEDEECEYLDFKIDMYQFNSKNNKRKWEARKEFIKDLLGLLNNKTREKNFGRAYIIIGIREENEKYNGFHKDINFKNTQTLFQLKNNYINPDLNIDIQDFYISGDKNDIKISIDKRDKFDRNIMIILTYQIGTVYEIKNKIGNPYYEVEYYYEGTSFTRDKSHSRRIKQDDREKIMSLKNEYDDNNEFDPYDVEFLHDGINQKQEILKPNSKVIQNRITILEKKNISNDNILNCFDSINRQLELLNPYQIIEDDLIKTLYLFISFSKEYVLGKEDIIINRILRILRKLTPFSNLVEKLKLEWLETLVDLFINGKRASDLIYLLKIFNYFADLLNIIIKSIDNRDEDLLLAISNFELEDFRKIEEVEGAIQILVEKKEELTSEKEKHLKEWINRIIQKLERIF